VQRLPSIVIVTTATRYEMLVGRWGTKGQARFRLKQAALHRTSAAVPGFVPAATKATTHTAEADFELFEAEDQRYRQTLETLRRELDLGLPVTLVERSFLPNYEFRNAVVVVVVGPDGLVANTAKYVGDLPIIGVNPDPQRIDGVLLPFAAKQVRSGIESVLDQRATVRNVSLAEARMNDGQRLLAFNDLFIGRRTHVSARYNLRYGQAAESQSSSGVIVATGAGSTGWLSSVFNMARGVNAWTGGPPIESLHLDWDTRALAWVVREPFASRHSQAELVAGSLGEGETLTLESLMPEGGVIFSDGIEADYLEFNSPATVQIGLAEQQAKIVVP